MLNDALSAIERSVANILDAFDFIADQFAAFTVRLYTFQCDEYRRHPRWRRCDCPVSLYQPPPRPVFLFHQVEETKTVVKPAKPEPIDDFARICQAVQEQQEAMAAVFKSGLTLLDTIRREDEPPPYPEFFINH
jgi:hypothetical protein